MADQQATAFTILALYKFVSPKWEEKYIKELRVELETFLRERQVFGNLLLGTEGINGTICYPSSYQQQEHDSSTDQQDEDRVCQFFSDKFPGIRLRLSYHDIQVFHRLRIRIKKEIVTLGVVDGAQVVDPCQTVGTYVPPGPAWHDLLQDPNALVIDTRNDYEVHLGTFQNAVNPHTTSFTEFPTWFQQQVETTKPTKIAMFCTGGIRCEKASSYCLNHPVVADAGIPVYHLEGGILAYLDRIPASESLWEGECFVFDQRTAVGHGLKPSTRYTLCHACRHPLDPCDRASSDFAPGVACPYCVHRQDKKESRSRYQERQRQCQLSEQTSIPHIHDGKLAKGSL